MICLFLLFITAVSQRMEWIDKKSRNQPIKAEAILNQSMHLYIQSTPKEFHA